MVGSVLGTRESEAPLPAEDFLLIVACGYFLVLALPPPTYWIYIHNITQPDLSPAECSALLLHTTDLFHGNRHKEERFVESDTQRR